MSLWKGKAHGWVLMCDSCQSQTENKHTLKGHLILKGISDILLLLCNWQLRCVMIQIYKTGVFPSICWVMWCDESFHMTRKQKPSTDRWQVKQRKHPMVLGHHQPPEQLQCSLALILHVSGEIVPKDIPSFDTHLHKPKVPAFLARVFHIQGKTGNTGNEQK